MNNAHGQVSSPVYGDIAQVVIPRRRISRRVGQLARQIALDYGGRDLTILAVMTGSLVFLADLIRRLPFRMRLNLVSVCSYPGTATVSTGRPKLLTDVPAGLAGQDVVIVDDILDSGNTLGRLVDEVRRAGAASVRTCILLQKTRDDLPGRMTADYVGFITDNQFLVGYGLDFDNLYRNLPDVCILKRHQERKEGRGEKGEGRKKRNQKASSSSSSSSLPLSLLRVSPSSSKGARHG